MVVPLHKKDWAKMEREDDFLTAAKDLELKVGRLHVPRLQFATGHEERGL